MSSEELNKVNEVQMLFTRTLAVSLAIYQNTCYLKYSCVINVKFFLVSYRLPFEE